NQETAATKALPTLPRLFQNARQIAAKQLSLLVRNHSPNRNHPTLVPQREFHPSVARRQQYSRPRTIATQFLCTSPFRAGPTKFLIGHSHPLVITLMLANQVKRIPKYPDFHARER
ncbi:MAG: hypothetical protein ABL931_20870, partial [Usitatibacteraceae bacterium]